MRDEPIVLKPPVAPGSMLRRCAPIGCVFAAHGVVLGGWATQVPVLRERLGLTPGALGAALFCAAAGAVLGMPGTAALVRRFGVEVVVRSGAFATGGALLLAVLAQDYLGLCLVLTGFGMAYGVVDVAMNAEAVRVERRAGRPVLGGIHAMWSVGAFAGSAGGAALLAVVSPVVQAGLLAAVSVGAVAVAAGRLGGPPGGPAAGRAGERPWRDRTLLLAGGVLCLAFGVEGAIADWGGVYLRVVRHVPAAQAALGYSAFSLCMVGMRLAGDRLRRRLGDARALMGAFAAAAGVAVVLVAPSPHMALAGFALAGLGMANVVPALFALAGARGGGDTGASVGVVSTLGYAGVLAGPPAFGFVAQASSLSVAVGAIGLLCCGVGVAGLVLRRA